MGRLFILVLLVLAAIWLMKRALARASREGAAQEPAVDDLVSCARCGVHLPRGEARAAGGRLYCGEEHARLGPAGGPPQP